ncbi:unnamed protein product [Caenorhabditis auriculariae]|uniref:Uncharacterized protein n=1 Tax=Caenorhabditis auriculariae TaxID=2777116 RepID=A0A8S1H370_9PELO|nr:unnamed protein product [Caenorhabditis auriculariae]
MDLLSEHLLVLFLLHNLLLITVVFACCKAKTAQQPVAESPSKVEPPPPAPVPTPKAELNSQKKPPNEPVPPAGNPGRSLRVITAVGKVRTPPKTTPPERKSEKRQKKSAGQRSRQPKTVTCQDPTLVTVTAPDTVEGPPVKLLRKRSSAAASKRSPCTDKAPTTAATAAEEEDDTMRFVASIND